jgi:tripartite-type tricarboxylate transporter receptor subunit TctC
MFRSLLIAAMLAITPAMAQTKVEIVSRIANTNVSGQLAVQFMQKLNETQSDYEFRFFTVPGSAGEGAYQRMLALKSNIILYGNQSFFSNPKTNANNRVDQIHFLTSHTVSYAAFMVNPDNPVNTIDEFVAQMQTKGGFYAGSINSSGGGPVLTSIFLDKYKLEDKVKIVHYKNVPDRVRAVFIKEADFMINNPASANVAEKGTLKMIAMSSPTRQLDYPTIPTGAELGFPEFNFGAYTSFAILKSEKELIAKIQPLFDKVCNDPEIKKHISERKYVPICINDESIKKMIADEKKMFIERGIEFDLD